MAALAGGALPVVETSETAGAEGIGVTIAGTAASSRGTRPPSRAYAQAAPLGPGRQGMRGGRGAAAELSLLQQDITNITQGPGVQRAVWGIVVESIDRQERLFELNPRTLLVPASVAKLIPVATALDSAGWNFRYETTLETVGTITDGILHGDLFVVGSGDPSIGGRGGDDLTGWIDALVALGVRQVEGRVIGDDNAQEEPRPAFSLAWDDLGTSGTLYGALNLEENRMPVTVVAGNAPGEPAGLLVDAAGMSRALVGRAVTGERGSVASLWTEQRPGELALTIAGTLPIGAPPARMAVSVGNPTLWFARSLRYRLIAAGIPVAGEAYDIDDLIVLPDRSTKTVLHVHRSRPLSEIIQPLLKDSINIYGEALLRLNGVGPAPTVDASVAGMAQTLTAWGIPAEGQQLVDGSGLSRRDVVAADTLAMVLRRMFNADNTTPWMSGFPVAGVDGTLLTRMRRTAAEKNVRAKTGSMSNIRSLAGYVTTRDGERLAFVILLNNFEGPGTTALQAIDSIAVRLASFSRKCCAR